MNKSEKYNKVIKILNANKPVLTDKGKLTDDVMNKISKSVEKTTIRKLTGKYLFGWTEIGWMRRAMAVVAVIFLGIFIVQQLVITDRINSLEKQLIRTVNNISTQDPDLGIMQKSLLNLLAKDQIEDDSITISRSDLEELMNSYIRLHDKYNKMKQNADVDSYIQKIIKRSLEERRKSKKSKL